MKKLRTQRRPRRLNLAARRIGFRSVEALEPRTMLDANPVLAVNDESQIAIFPTASALAPPTTILAKAAGPTSVFIDWTDVVGASGYALERSISPTEGFTQIYQGTLSQYLDSGPHLVPLTTYYYRARTLHFTGDSTYTEVVAATPTPFGEIRGTVFNDVDQDGERDPGEGPLANWTVYIDANNNGAYDDGEPTQTTDVNGEYAFTDLPKGVYTVRQIVEPGWTQSFPRTRPPSEFSIQVVFADDNLTPSQRAIFELAAARWSEIIIGDVPDVFVPGFGLVDDLVIEASALFLDGPGGLLGQAGPTLVRTQSTLPIAGIMQFDIADLAYYEANGQLIEIILHEMGHVIGIGTIWPSLNLLTGAGTDNPRFTGGGAVAEYNRIFGLNETSVPVENRGGRGTADGHWRETVFVNELMTGFLNEGVVNPLSRMTAASLGDLGYEVDVNRADPYTKPVAPATPLVGLTSEPVTAHMLPLDEPFQFLSSYVATAPLPPGSTMNIAIESNGYWTVTIAPAEVVTGVDFGNFFDTTPRPEIELRGNGVVIVDGDTTPSQADHTDFGATPVGGSPIIRTFEIANTGNGPLNLSIPPGGALVGPHASDFTFVALPSPVIAPGESTTFQIQFAPSGNGLRSASINLGSNDADENPYNFAIQGFGGEAPPQGAIGGSVWIDRNGNGVRDQDDDPLSNWTIYVDADNDGELDAGELTDVTDANGAYSFTGLSIGTYVIRQVVQAGWEATFPASGFWNIILAAGQVVTDADFAAKQLPPVPPEIVVRGNGETILDGDTTPAFFDHTDFGVVNVAGGQVTREFTILNLGDGVLNLTGTPRVSISGPNANEFQVTVQPAATITAGGSTTFEIRFDPSGTGVRSATVTILNDDDDEGSYEFAISGAGFIAGSDVGDTFATALNTTLGAGTNTLNHSEIIGNGANGPRDVDLYRFTATAGKVFTASTAPVDGGADVDTVLRLFSASGQELALNDNDPFSFYSRIDGFVIPATGVYFLGVSGSPNKTYSMVNASGTVAGGVGNYRLTASLSDGPLPDIVVQGNNIAIQDGDATPSTDDGTDFGSMTVAAGIVTRTFTILNPGTADLELTGDPIISITGAHASDFTVTELPSDTVAAGQSTSFQITFNPSAAGIRTATVTIASNDSDDSPYTFSVQGFGDDTVYSTTIRGRVFNDLNVNGKQDGSESPLAGWMIYIDSDDDGQLDPHELTVTSDEFGDYVFTGLPPGTYIVREVLQPGWERSTPNSGFYSIQVFGPNFNGSGLLFGNRLIPAFPPEIDIRVGDVSIARSAPEPPEGTVRDFGTVDVDGGARSRTFTILNLGTGPLDLIDDPLVRIGILIGSGSNPEDVDAFTVTSFPDAVIPPGGATSFEITFDPLREGFHKVVVVVQNTDIDEANYFFEIIGVGGEPPAPVGSPDEATVQEDGFVDINVLANDEGTPLGGPLSVIDIVQPQNGQVTLNPNGTVRYRPDPDFAGVDSFTYRVKDGNGESEDTTVTITVTNVNDPPEILAPIPDTDVGADVSDLVFDLGLVFGDVDVPAGDVLIYSVVFNSNTSLVQTSIENGQLILDFAASARGSATLRVRATDEAGQFVELSFNVTADANQAPIANSDTFVLSNLSANVSGPFGGVLFNDIDPDGDALTVTLVKAPTGGTLVLDPTGAFTYTRNGRFAGIDRFTYRVSDGRAISEEAEVTILSYEATQVVKLYNQVLGRDPEEQGIKFWVNGIKNGATYGQIASGIFESDERLTPIIEQFYRDYLLRDPAGDAAGVAFWRDVWKRDGGPDNVIAGMISSAEFYNSAGGTDEGWVKEMYLRLLGRAADGNGLSFWVMELARGRMTREQVVLGFVRSSENFLNLIAAWHQQYLGRNATSIELGKFLAQMRAGASQRDVQISIIDSLEYRNTPAPPAAGTVERLE